LQNNQFDKYYGFVSFSKKEEAEAAINAMHESTLEGECLYVNIAETRAEREQKQAEQHDDQDVYYRNLYVGNLPLNYDQKALKRLFQPYGLLSNVTIVINRDTSKSKGFGFVRSSPTQQMSHTRADHLVCNCTQTLCVMQVCYSRKECALQAMGALQGKHAPPVDGAKMENKTLVVAFASNRTMFAPELEQMALVRGLQNKPNVKKHMQSSRNACTPCKARQPQQGADGNARCGAAQGCTHAAQTSSSKLLSGVRPYTHISSLPRQACYTNLNIHIPTRCPTLCIGWGFTVQHASGAECMHETPGMQTTGLPSKCMKHWLW
jgi:RNA recognition motif. (a.k.a. RRM, RBD, or RNP domain)